MVPTNMQASRMDHSTQSPVYRTGSIERNATLRSRPGRLRVRLTREGKLYLVILLVLLGSALVNEINLLVLLFGMMAGPFLFSALLAWNALRGIEVRRSAPPEVEAGETFSVQIVIENRKVLGGAWSIRVEDALHRTSTSEEPIEPFRPSVWFLYARGGEQITGTYRGVISQRGLYELRSLKASTRFPLGLVEVSRMFPASEPLVVYPRSGRLTQRWSRQLLGASTSQGSRRARAAAGGSDYHSLRDFRPGDNPRWIHWRTSARQGQLMVREFDESRRHDLSIVLDLWVPSEPTLHDRSLVELALSAVATVCSEACRAGRNRLLLVLAGDPVETIQGHASPALLHRIRQRMAVAVARRGTELRYTLQRAGATITPGLAGLLDGWEQPANGVLLVTSCQAAGSRSVENRSERRSGTERNGRLRRSVYVGGAELSELYQWR